MIEDVAFLIVPVAVVALMSVPLTARAVVNRRNPQRRPHGSPKSRAFRKSRKRGRKQPHEVPETSADRWLYHGTMFFVGAIVVAFGVVLLRQSNFYAYLWAGTAISGGAAILLAPLAYRGKPVPRDWYQTLGLAGFLIALLGAIVLGIVAIIMCILAISMTQMWPTAIAGAGAAAVLIAFVFYYLWLEDRVA